LGTSAPLMTRPWLAPEPVPAGKNAFNSPAVCRPGRRPGKRVVADFDGPGALADRDCPASVASYCASSRPWAEAACGASPTNAAAHRPKTSLVGCETARLAVTNGLSRDRRELMFMFM